MRVLAVTPSYPRFPEDYHGRFIHDLCQKLSQRGVEIRVLAPRSNCSRPLGAGFNVRRFPFIPRQEWETLSGSTMKNAPVVRLVQLPPYLVSAHIHMAAIPASVVHAHLAIPMGFLAAFRPGGAPLVVTCHGSDCTLPCTKPFLRPFARHALTRADRVVAVSNFVANLAMRLGAPPENVETIPIGVDVSRFKPPEDSASLRERFGIAEGCTVIGSLGRLVREKRVEDIVKAARQVSKKADIVLLIGGDGPQRRYLEDLAGKDGDIRFLGEVWDAALFHRLCDVFVLASMREGLSVALQEAMATGCVPVALNGWGCPELVEDGENGYLFEPGDLQGMADGILKAIESPGLGSKASETIRSHFDLEESATRHIELYEGLVDLGC